MSGTGDPVVISLGSINADFQMRIDRSLKGIETLPAHDFTRLGGGKAANRAFLARKLGHAATLIGRVGTDELAEQALAGVRAAGIDLAGVTAAEGATAVSVIAVPPEGKKAILLAGNANNSWDEPAIATMTRLIAEAPKRSILGVDYEVPAAVVRSAVAGRAGFPVVIDPSWPDRVEPAVLARARAVTPNAEEAGELTGIKVEDADGAARAAARLAERGVPFVAVKLGSWRMAGACAGRAASSRIFRRKRRRSWIPRGRATPLPARRRWRCSRADRAWRPRCSPPPPRNWPSPPGDRSRPTPTAARSRS